MWLLIVVLLGISGLVGIVRVSLPEERWYGVVAALALGAASFAAYPLVIRGSVRNLENWLRSEQVLAAICTLVTFEAIGLVLLSVQWIRRHYGRPIGRWSRGLGFLPAPSLLLGLSLLQMWFFHRAENRPFMHTAAIFSIGVVLGCHASWWLCLRVAPRWETRLYWCVGGAFLQLVFAMFLPLVFTRLTVLDNHLAIDPRAFFLVLGLTLAAALGGALLDRFRSPL